jgi:glutamyl-tRNA synthetase
VKERQSDRLAHYDRARDALISSGRLYPCYETPEELEFKRRRLLAQGRPPIYDRTALKLDDAARRQLEGEGRTPHWRFKLESSEVRWDDLARGPQHVDEASQSDPVLVRADGSYLYSFTSVVDDIDFAITHVIRGEDHVTNTAVQIEIFEALGAAVPAFAHFPLLVGAGGEALSKRIGSLSLQEIRAEGIEPLALASYLAKTGTSDAIELRPSLQALVHEFDFAKIGRAPAHFDPAELKGLNARLLHSLPYTEVRERLEALGIPASEAFWEAVKANVIHLSDTKDLWTLVTGPVTPALEDASLAAKAAELLPPEPWDDSTWSAWTKAVSDATGTKGKGLFHPLRLALTGRDSGPEMKKLLPLIGRTRALARLNGRSA